MSDFQASDVSINKVYDFAYDIAQEFDKLVFLYGIDKVRPVVDKVINVLEVLELSVEKIEQLEAELRDLKTINLHLSSEKLLSDHEKSKLKQIYEESEELLLAEVVSLKSQLSAAKSENNLLRNDLAVKGDTSSTSDDTLYTAIQDKENVIRKLNRTVKQKEKQLQDNVHNINTLNTRIQELLRTNKILHLKNQEARNEITKLILEKNDFKSELILQKKENILLMENIDELIHSSSECNNKTLSAESSEEALVKDVNFYKKQEMHILEKIKKLQAELQVARSQSQQCQENVFKINSVESKMPFSKIHQLFHLFLGVTAISEFCWIGKQ